MTTNQLLTLHGTRTHPSPGPNFSGVEKWSRRIVLLTLLTSVVRAVLS